MSEELKVRAIQWRDKINSRIGPISGRDADAIAAFLNIVSAEIGRAEKAERERDELRAALEEAATPSHADLCALSRLVGERMSLHINQPGHRINEWLKRQIAARAALTATKKEG